VYLFKEQEVVEIPINCKICLKNIKFTVTSDEYKKTKIFPIKKEDIHGAPRHRLTVFINKHLDIENFELEDKLDQEEETTTVDQEITRQVLKNLDLSENEVELYLKITGRDAVSLGELALIANKSKEETSAIAAHFVQKGLFKEIVGATPHFTALPPYAALVSQLRTFHTYINDLRKSAPVELNESFAKLESSAEGIKNLKEYTDFMLDLKESTLSNIMAQKKQFDKTSGVIDEIGGLSDFILNLESEAKNIMDKQIDELTKQFNNISEKISQGMDRQIDELSKQFDNINAQITGLVRKQIDEFMKNFEIMKQRVSQNLAKLRLGVLQQAVDQVIEMSFSEWLNIINQSLRNQLGDIEKISKDGLVKTKISLSRQLNEIQKAQNDGIKNTTDKFNEMLISKLKDTITSTVDNIKGITASTAKSGDEIKKLFGDISKNFSKAVSMAEEKLGGMSESVFSSFSGLRNTFSSTIIDALNDILNNILKRLELSENAIKQFWDQAIAGGIGGAAALTMQDIWFIRSIEGAKAHVNDQTSQAKMRVLIVAPQITDVNLSSIKACKVHVNIRIATSVDLSNPEHMAIVEELTKMQNVSVRNRKLQNLWGINRDYEEVILCVLSKTEVKGQTKTEIAGIGSIIQEHIKIFVPILEDAWMGSQKELVVGKISQNNQPEIKETPAQIQPTRTLQSTKPVISQASQPVSTKKPIQQRPEIKIPEAVIPSRSETSDVSGDLSKKFDSLSNLLNKMTGTQIASKLQEIKDIIESNRGYSGVVSPINSTISELKLDPKVLNNNAIEQLTKKMNFWRKKLNI